MNEVRRALERVEVPDEHEARERAWALVSTAYAEREPEPRRLPLRALVAAAAALALVGAALSPPGRAVIDEVRDAIGVEDAEPQLFSLPAAGRLLVTSERGTWVVRADGSRRLLGRYREASWSPNGRFVAAARANELVALEPGTGDLRWSLPRPDVRFPRWAGSATDTRIAYLSDGTLRIVAGDGTGDRELGRARQVAPAWRPGSRYELAYVTAEGRLRIVEAQTGRQLFLQDAPAAQFRRLLWSSDGQVLVVVYRGRVEVRLAGGRRIDGFSQGRFATGEITAAALHGRVLAYAVAGNGRSLVRARRLTPNVGAHPLWFEGDGRFTQLEWSPDGSWLLIGWDDPDQWVFRSDTGTVKAVSRISTQFRADEPPSVEGWCCAQAATPSREESASAPARRAPERSGAPAREAIVWRRSASVGLPWAGRLVDGVRFPADGARFFTWDPVERRMPSPGWRRWGSDRLVRTLLRVIDEHAAAHPDAPRVAVGDLSRPHGGDFGPQWGGPGHISHQNGLDADVYFPRRDGKERPPDRPEHVDRKLAQDLVDRFVAAGAQKVFVGPNVGLTGPRGVVEELAAHDNHLHVRLPPAR